MSLLRYFGRIRFRGTHPSRRHSSVRLHSGDSLGTGAANAASVAAHAHRMPCRLSGRPSKAHPSLRPQDEFILSRIYGTMCCGGWGHSPKCQLVCGRTCRAGSGGGLPVFRDARSEPRQTVR